MALPISLTRTASRGRGARVAVGRGCAVPVTAAARAYAPSRLRRLAAESVVENTSRGPKEPDPATHSLDSFLPVIQCCSVKE